MAAAMTLCAAAAALAAESDAAPWSVVRCDSRALEAELAFDAEGVFVFGLKEEGKGVLALSSSAADGRARRFELTPVLGRELPRSPLTVFAHGSGPTLLCTVAFTPPEGWQPFACEGASGTDLVTIRKKTVHVPAGGARVLLGGSAVWPDMVARAGWSGAGRGSALGPIADALERMTALLPSVCRGAAGPVYAWSMPATCAVPGVWATSIGGRPVRLAESGRYPALASSGNAVLCAWSDAGAVLVATSADGGATWGAARRIAEAHDIACVSAAARGDSMAVAWEVPQGIMWRVSADGGRTFSGGDLMGNHFRPRLEYLQDGALGLVMLQKGPRGAEAAFARIAADGRAGEKTETLLASVPVLDAAVREIAGTPFFAYIVRSGKVERLAHRTATGRTYFLPDTRGTPFAVDVGMWEREICISCAQVREGGIELVAFRSADGGLTWAGPTRLLSGRSLCAVGAELVVTWQGAHGVVTLNGKEVFAIPAGVPRGRARVGLDPSSCASQGWVADRVGFTGEGAVDATVLLRTPPSEDVAPGQNEAHAAGFAGGMRRPIPGPDLAVVADTLSTKKLMGRAGGELALPLAIANVGDRVSGAFAFVVRAGDAELFRKECEAIEPGGETLVSAFVPLPRTAGTAELVCVLEAKEDRDRANDTLALAAEVRPETVTTLSPGTETRLELPDEGSVTVRWERPCYVTVAAGGLDLAAVTAIVTAPGADGAKREVSCDRPIDIAAGAHRVVFRAPSAGVITVRVAEKSDAFEPNDRPEQAAPVAPGSEIDTCLTPAGDRDWFSVTVAEAGHLTVKATGLPAGGEVVASVRGGGAWIVRDAALPCAAFVQAGTYEILIAERWGRAAVEPFRVRIGFAGAADADEPNDTPACARALDLAQGEKVVLDPAGDKDWFVVETPRAGYLAFSVADAAADVTCLVAGPEEDSIAPPAELPATFRVPAGKVYVCFSTRAELRVVASVGATFVAEQAAAGAGAGAVDVRAATLPGTADVQLWPAGERAAFAVTVPAYGCLDVRVADKAPPGLAPAVTLWIGGEPRGGVRPLPASLRVEPGEARMEVRDLLARGSELPFRIAFAFTPAPDAERPHDTPDRAQPLACPGGARMALWPCDDAAFFSVEVASRGMLVLEAAGIEQALEFFFAGDKSARKVQRGRAAAVRVEPGPCLVRVRPLAPLRDPLRCTLSARLEAFDDACEPNDTPETATPLAAGQWRAISLYPQDEQDYFRIEVGERTSFVFETRGVPRELAPRLDVPGREGTAGGVSTASGGSVTLEAGMHVVRVRDAVGRGVRTLFEFRLAPATQGVK